MLASSRQFFFFFVCTVCFACVLSAVGFKFGVLWGGFSPCLFSCRIVLPAVKFNVHDAGNGYLTPLRGIVLFWRPWLLFFFSYVLVSVYVSISLVSSCLVLFLIH